MTEAPTASQIAAMLTKAQRAWLTTKAVWEYGAWHTFPPSNTGRVLHGLRLWDWSGAIRSDGLAVRAILMEKDRG